jgi:hypothetical protein
MKTILLLLLPLNTLAKCVSPSAINPNAYLAALGFPTPCEWYSASQEVVLPCLGARNRYLQFWRVNAAGTYTVTLTSQNPNVVFALWDGCPLTGGDVVVSLDCGGYDCMSIEGNTTTLTFTLPTGEYYFWMGLYSDGFECETGVLSFAWNAGGGCSEPGDPEDDCDITAIGFAMHTHCGCFNEPIAPLPCPNNIQSNYSVINFTVNYDAPTPIAATSATNYAWSPNGPNVYAHAFILQDGEVVWTTIGGACAVNVYPSSGDWPSQNWEGFIDLPQGQYQVVFGYIGGDLGGAQNQIGCVDLVIGIPILLSEPEPEPQGGKWSGGEYQPRYTKVVIEGRGVFVRDNYTGKLYDYLTREQQ